MGWQIPYVHKTHIELFDNLSPISYYKQLLIDIITMANTKEVVLNRAVSETGQLGSFGFSIMGGAKAKIPCVVCNIEPRGPADASNKVRQQFIVTPIVLLSLTIVNVNLN